MKFEELKDFVDALHKKESEKSRVIMLAQRHDDDGDYSIDLGFCGNLSIHLSPDTLAEMTKKDVLNAIYNNLEGLIKGIMDNIGLVDDLHQRLQKVVG